MEKLSSVALLKKYFTDLKTEDMKTAVLSREVRIELADLVAVELGYTKNVDVNGDVTYTK